MRNSWEGGWGSQKQGSNQDMNTEVKPACVYSVKLKCAKLLIVKREKKKVKVKKNMSEMLLKDLLPTFKSSVM